MGRDRAYLEHPDGFLIIKPTAGIDPIPFFCQVCGHPMTSSDDSDSHRQDGCCNMCVMQWMVPNREQWEQGWRPSRADIEARRRTRRVVVMRR